MKRYPLDLSVEEGVEIAPLLLKLGGERVRRRWNPAK